MQALQSLACLYLAWERSPGATLSSRPKIFDNPRILRVIQLPQWSTFVHEVEAATMCWEQIQMHRHLGAIMANLSGEDVCCCIPRCNLCGAFLLGSLPRLCICHKVGPTST